jgi:hypothetical protein
VPSSVTFDDGRRIVVLEYTGPLDIELVMEGGVEAARIALQHGCGVLVDTRRIEKPLPLKDLIGVAQGLGHIGVQPGQRIAVLASPFDAENAVFGSFANEAGFEVRTYSDEAEAVAWLREAEPAGPTSRATSPSAGTR